MLILYTPHATYFKYKSEDEADGADRKEKDGRRLRDYGGIFNHILLLCGPCDSHRRRRS